jgi:hypothetical protein
LTRVFALNNIVSAMKPAIVLLLFCTAACSQQSSTSIPSGMIAMFDRECPDGWTRYTEMDRRFPRGALQAGELGGREEHSHSFDITARTSKDGTHIHMLAMGEEVQVDQGTWGHVAVYKGHIQAFEHAGKERTKAPRAKAVTDQDGAHDHMISVQGESRNSPSLPPYLNLVFCRKD